MKSIEPDNDFLFSYVNVIIISIIAFFISYVKFNSLIGGFLSMGLFIGLILYYRNSKIKISKIVFTETNILKVTIIENNISREVLLDNVKPHFELKKRTSSKMRTMNYDAFLYLENSEKIELSSIQGWDAKKLIKFFLENGILYNID